MIKTILINAGETNQGKTQSLQAACKYLIQAGAVIQVNRNLENKNNRYLTNVNDINSQQDIEVVLELNGQFIGIASAGEVHTWDPAHPEGTRSDVCDATAYIIHNKCDLLLCACSNDAQSSANPQIVEQLLADELRVPYTVAYLSNLRTPDERLQAALNDYSGRQIARVIQDIVGGDLKPSFA